MIQLGWTLLHFLWQGTLIAGLLAVVRAGWGRGMSARSRYALACAALAAMTLTPVLTFIALGQTPEASPRIAWTIPAQEWQRLLPWLVNAWFAGVAVFSIRLVGGWTMASRLRREAVRPAPAEWELEFERLIERMGVSKAVRLLVSGLVETPVAIGWLRPVILMPAGALTGLPPEHALALLAHELGHVLRNDYLANMLQSAAEALLFYHPAVWWVSDQIRQEREQCCDDLAVAVTGGNVLLYARALAQVEAARPAHLKTLLAANGGSLVMRIRRLIGQAPSISQMVPGPGAAAALVVLLVVGMGSAAMRGNSQGTPPAQAALVKPALVKPMVQALLYDPLFEPPRPAAQVRSAAQVRIAAQVRPAPPLEPPKAPETAPAVPDKQYGHRIAFQAAYLVDSDEPMQAPSPQTLASVIARLGLDDANARSVAVRIAPISATFTGAGTSQPKFTSQVPGIVLETWAENTYSSFVESTGSPQAKIERSEGCATIHPSFQDRQRKLSIDYAVTVEILPQPGTYRVSFPESVAENIPAGFTRVSPAFPAPQIAHDGDAIRLALYRDPASGVELVDYIHVGALNKITPRTEAPHDSYADDTEFNLTGAAVKMNGVKQEVGAIPATLRGLVAWIYVPGHGRYTLSFKPSPGDQISGEANGNSIVFQEERDILRIECSDRIAPGSGSYAVHALKEATWIPQDPHDRELVQIGAGISR